MASIERRNGKWRVRWRDPDGRSRSRQCPTKRAALELEAQIEASSSIGHRWEPRDAREEADIRLLLKDYAEDCARVLRPNTAIRYARALDLFLRYLEQLYGKGAPLPPSVLTRRLLADWHTALKHDGLHGRDRKDATRRKLVEVAQLAWAWIYDNDESGIEIPPPRKIRMVREPASPTVAPTWIEMDGCIGALTGWQHDLAILLRFTGLRVQQAMSLTWDDLDLDAQVLRVRGELGKTPQERRGRVVPVSPHLVDELERWPKADEPWLVVSTRQLGGDRERMARARDFNRAWFRAGVRQAAWRGRPHHAFRKGFVSELRRAGIDADAVEYLVGHSLGLRGVYTDPSALPLEAAVELIPPLALGAYDTEATDQLRFDGLDPHDPRPIREITLDDIQQHPEDPLCPRSVPALRREVENVVFVDFSGEQNRRRDISAPEGRNGRARGPLGRNARRSKTTRASTSKKPRREAGSFDGGGGGSRSRFSFPR